MNNVFLSPWWSILSNPYGGIILVKMLFSWAIMLFVFSALLMWLWNITITMIFSIREITFWEAFRLLLIAGILFGKIGFNMQF